MAPECLISCLISFILIPQHKKAICFISHKGEKKANYFHHPGSLYLSFLLPELIGVTELIFRTLPASSRIFVPFPDLCTFHPGSLYLSSRIFVPFIPDLCTLLKVTLCFCVLFARVKHLKYVKYK